MASPGNLIAISKVAPDKVLLKWDAVPGIDVAGIPRGYTITYKKTKDIGEFVDDDEKQINIFDPQQTEILIEGLEYYCRYSFRIRVFNGRLYGDDSEQVHAGKGKMLSGFSYCSQSLK